MRYKKSKARSPWDDPTPRWRRALIPPEWFQLLLAVGPREWSRIVRNPEHPWRLRRHIHTDGEIRGRWRQWYGALTQAQRDRYFLGCPKLKRRELRTARIYRPDAFHPEQARIRRENAQMRAWSIVTGRDPVHSPWYQGRLERLGKRLSDEGI
ncbi:MAG: hypothetical protein JNM59_07035 [Hyphomonadaceae bacterium]|nr:hypothetical protein [Hyphomonadaceae bacterium]